MMNTGLVNTLANERIHGSSAWRYHTLTAMNLSAEDLYVTLLLNMCLSSSS